MHYEKRTVGVYLYTDTNGKSLPVALKWENGKIYMIDKVLSVRYAPPENVGGIATARYDVKISGKVKTVYYEKYKNTWFVEKPVY